MDDQPKPKAELNLCQGPLRINLSQHSETLSATLHASNRKLETSVMHFPRTEDRDEPFNTLDFEVNGTRLDLFLSDTQLEELSAMLANEIALR